MDTQRYKPSFSQSIAHHTLSIGECIRGFLTRIAKAFWGAYQFGIDLPTFFKSSDTQSRQALLLSLLLMVLVNLHRDIPASSTIRVLHVPTASLRGSIDKPVSFNASARQIADAQRHRIAPTGSHTAKSSLGSRPIMKAHAPKASKNSVTSTATDRASDIRLPGAHSVKLRQPISIQKSPMEAWLETHPIYNNSKAFGFSRPRWRSYEHVSLQQRYGKRSSNPIYTVMLDPGHGGSDPGAEGHNGLLEKEITLDIARRTALLLSEVPNVQVQMTRQSDRGMSRSQRVTKIKNSHSDLVVSLHLNHLPQTELTLVETFYAGPENIRESQLKQAEEIAAKGLVKTNVPTAHNFSFTSNSAKLASIMQSRLYDEVKRSNKAAISAGVKQDTLFVLTRSFTPGALIEMTCLSNEQEADLLATEGYRNRLAAALADGIRHYVLEEQADREARQLASGEIIEKSI